MAFKLRIVFTGLCAFVRNTDETKRARMCIVLPDGRGREVTRFRESADSQPLRRHFGFLQFKIHQLAALADSQEFLSKDTDAIWYLDHHRVTFLTTPADRRRQPFPFVDTGINRIAKLDMIVPKHSEIDPQALEDHPPATILAQVLLHEGVLSHNPLVHQWVFPPTLAGRVLNPFLSHEVILEVPDLEQVDVIATPFNGGEPARWSFFGRDNEDVTLTLANLCDDNPLRWETNGTRVVDDDFRWYYRLLSAEAQQDLSAQLRGLPFPVPYPIPEEIEEPNGQAINCIPAQMTSAAFNLDRHLPSGLVVQPQRQPLSQSVRNETRRAK